jgi:isocitrate/isopropylmalate dehydrogenase
VTTNRVHRVAVIPGDGIGHEVIPEGLRGLEGGQGIANPIGQICPGP